MIRVDLFSQIFALICFVLIREASALSCDVCVENNLDEFGECAKSIQVDCANYARRNSNQNIFCRTTRNRANNGSYSIVKECISELAHYATFPRTKNLKLEEECDVVDVDGAEVAYCLCRTGDYCNHAAIVDQFTTFENKYPEFFDPVRPSQLQEEADYQAGSTPPSGFDFEAAEETTPPAATDSIRRNYVTKAPNKFDSADSALKFAAEHDLLSENGDDTPSTAADDIIQRPTPISPVATFSPPQAPPPLPIVPVAGARNSAAAHSAGILANASPHQFSLPFNNLLPSNSALSCMQCSEANLADAAADCQDQVQVDCPMNRAPTLGRPLCFSRQIVTPKGEYGVEKMCVPERAVLEEFGEDAVLDGCQSIESGTVVSRYCVCATPNCNRASVSQQISFDDKNNIEPKLGGNTNKNQANAPLMSATPTKVRGSNLSCAVCLDATLRSALADCQEIEKKMCPLVPGQRSYCLTRQTQNGKGSFIVAKNCTTHQKFLDDFPEEKQFMAAEERDGVTTMAPRCASTYNGNVNFCICDGDLCNRDALPQQAERISSTSRGTTSIPTNTLAGLQPIQPVMVASNFGDKNTGIFPAFQEQSTKFPETTPERSPPPRFSATPISVTRGTSATWRPNVNDATEPPARATPNSHSATADATTNERLERWKASIAASSVVDSALSAPPVAALRHAFALLVTIFIASLAI